MKRLAVVGLLLLACSNRHDAAPSAPPVPAPPATKPAPPPAMVAPPEPPLAAQESAVAPEVNPPGDIPDSQAFVRFTSTDGGYSLEVPEGWARTTVGGDVSFVDRFDGVKVAITPATAAPTAGQSKTVDGRAPTITRTDDVTLPGGPAVRIRFTSNSDPNPVTNKQLRLEDEAYLFYRDGKLATVTLWAPKGADNVDQWTRMSRSFRWTP